MYKLLDSTLHGTTSNAELFLVEGDSASQAVANCRNAHFQAVLPMQGKPMNVYKASLQKIQQNPLFVALHTSITGDINIACSIEKCRYQRIILLMDPDADGIHCAALMLLYFHRFMPELLTAGMLHIVRAPVGEMVNTANNTTEYAFNIAQFTALLNVQKNNLQQNNAQQNNANISYQVVKYRGLAGIAVNVLSECCINPKTRTTSILGIKDAVMALEIFG